MQLFSCISHFYFLFVLCGRLSWLPVSFLLHVKYTLSYRMSSNGKIFKRTYLTNLLIVQVFLVYTQSVQQLHLHRHADEHATAWGLCRSLSSTKHCQSSLASLTPALSTLHKSYRQVPSDHKGSILYYETSCAISLHHNVCFISTI